MRCVPALLPAAFALLACRAEPSLLRSDIEVETHAGQPMVVDLLFERAPAAELALVHLTDAGVSWAELSEDPDGRTRLRLRGLAPASTHELELQLLDGEQEERHALSFTSLDPLPGFVPHFEVEAAPNATISADYRLFDLSVLFADEPLGAYVVDTAGVTRWYSGAMPQSLGLSALWGGLSLRADGQLLFIRDDAALIVDELGSETMRVDADSLGVPGFHHDILELPSGDFVALSLSFRDIDYGPEGVLPVAGDLIVEFNAAGEVLWTWDSFDHLDVERRVADFWGDFVYVHPDTGVEHHDWTHGNGIVYDAERDELLVSLRHQDWILAIDRGSGEIEWALGPGGDFTLASGSWFWHQHSPQWQPDGSLLLYDNGIGDPELPLAQARSRAVRYELDRETFVATQVWEEDSEPFLSTVAGDADRSSSGSVLALDSLLPLDPGDPSAGARMRVRELDPEASPMTQWTLTGPTGFFSYRALPVTRLVGEGE